MNNHLKPSIFTLINRTINQHEPSFKNIKSTFVDPLPQVQSQPGAPLDRRICWSPRGPKIPMEEWRLAPGQHMFHSGSGDHVSIPEPLLGMEQLQFTTKNRILWTIIFRCYSLSLSLSLSLHIYIYNPIKFHGHCFWFSPIFKCFSHVDYIYIHTHVINIYIYTPAVVLQQVIISAVRKGM